ncbi:PTS sugar transporter subunit IIB, partial [Liquorilactobacillus sicerae]|uniref:PTS sugar transporter subunit IIB n=1 Tax=Liquorilactobacillus sicerae TaxID=1416943 RepID=UPI002480ED0F
VNGRYDSQRVFILARRPKVLLDMIDGGVEINEVNVGNMSQASGTRPLTKSINIVQADIDAFNALHEKGLKMTVQMVPSDPAVDLMQLLKKFGSI